MASVTGTPDEIEAALAPWDGRLSVAAVNGPRSLVVAGEATALDAFVRSPRAEGLSPRRIAVGYGSHSPQVERIERRLADETPARSRPGPPPSPSSPPSPATSSTPPGSTRRTGTATCAARSGSTTPYGS